MAENLPPNDDDSPIQQAGRAARWNWFQSRPEKERDAVIEPKFDEAFPSNAEKREAMNTYGNKQQPKPETD